MKGAAIARAILSGGLIAATIDIGAACLINHRSIPFILHSIAGGLLAMDSFRGGAGTAFMGLFLQEFMGLVIAAVYVGAALALPTLLHRWIPCGVAYGVVIFMVMNYVVVPLSAWRRVPHFTAATFVANLMAMLLFGGIVAYSASRRIPAGAARVRGPGPGRESPRS